MKAIGKGLKDLLDMVHTAEDILMKNVARHFQNKDILTKDEFTELVEISHKQMLRIRNARTKQNPPN